jgi:hypothetical protein
LCVRRVRIHALVANKAKANFALGDSGGSILYAQAHDHSGKQLGDLPVRVAGQHALGAVTHDRGKFDT